MLYVGPDVPRRKVGPDVHRDRTSFGAHRDWFPAPDVHRDENDVRLHGFAFYGQLKEGSVQIRFELEHEHDSWSKLQWFVVFRMASNDNATPTEVEFTTDEQQ